MSVAMCVVAVWFAASVMLVGAMYSTRRSRHLAKWLFGETFGANVVRLPQQTAKTVAEERKIAA